jgi:Putative prokaryotic signal transducing protein
LTVQDSDLVRVAYANDEAEAELIQGLLRNADVVSVVRRAPGFDVPDFLAAGPREVLVSASDVGLAREILRQDDPVEPAAPSRSGEERPSRRLIAGLLIVLALVTLVVCLAADVFP